MLLRVKSGYFYHTVTVLLKFEDKFISNESFDLLFSNSETLSMFDWEITCFFICTQWIKLKQQREQAAAAMRTSEEVQKSKL